MSLNYVTLTGTLPGAAGALLTATLSGWIPDATDELLFPPAPDPVTLSYTVVNGVPCGKFSISLLANDNVNIAAGTYWTLAVTGINNLAYYSQTVILNHANGATQDISGLATYDAPSSVTGVMPLPTGIPASGQVPVATGVGEASAWGTVSGGGGNTLTRATVLTSSGNATANTVVPVNTTSNAVTVTLPSAPAGGTIVAIKCIIFGAGHNVTVSTAGSDVFNASGGSTSITLAAVNQGVYLCYDAATAIWTELADDLPLAYLESLFSPVSTNAAPAGFTPSNPAAWTNATMVMMGLGSACTYTPSGSGLVAVTIIGYVANSSSDGCPTGARYGTGAAPAGVLSATATNASPCVFTAPGSAYANGTQVALSGTPPTGFTTGTTYYVVGASGDTFGLSATLSGSAINSSSTGSSILVGSLAVGARAGSVGDPTILGTAASPGCFAATALLVLQPATSYWFDMAVNAAGGHSTAITDIGMTIFELP